MYYFQESSSPKLSSLSGASAPRTPSFFSRQAPSSPVVTSGSSSAKYVSQDQSILTALPMRNRNVNGTSSVTSSAPHHTSTMPPPTGPASARAPIRNNLSHELPRAVIQPQRPPPNAPTAPTALARPPQKSGTGATLNSNPIVPHQSLEPSGSHGTMEQRPTLATLPVAQLLQQPTDRILSFSDALRKTTVMLIEKHNKIVDGLEGKKVAVPPRKLSLHSSDDEAGEGQI